MKKIFGLLLAVCLTASCLFAEEAILLKSDASASLDGYDYVSNFEIKSSSGYFTKNDLEILKPNEKGFRFIAKGVPEDKSTHYEIYPSYPAFLNEANSGSGYIENAAAIKSIKVVGTTNRPYDEVILLYSTSPTGEIKSIKMPQDFNTIKSMEEFTLEFNNPLYEPDVTKRNVSAKPVLGADADGIYFRGFSIQTNSPIGTMSDYSQYSVFYLKEVSVVFDKAFTDEQIAAKKALKEEFEIDENAAATKKAKAYVTERNRVRDNEKALMASEEKKETSTDAK